MADTHISRFGARHGDPPFPNASIRPASDASCSEEDAAAGDTRDYARFVDVQQRRALIIAELEYPDTPAPSTARRQVTNSIDIGKLADVRRREPDAWNR